MMKSEMIALLKCPLCGRVSCKSAGATWLDEDTFRELHKDDDRLARGNIDFENVHCQECAEEHPSGDETVFDDGNDDLDGNNGDRTRDR